MTFENDKYSMKNMEEVADWLSERSGGLRVIVDWIDSLIVESPSRDNYKTMPSPWLEGMVKRHGRHFDLSVCIPGNPIERVRVEVER